MRSRNREINIFNLSMLDVIAGAMGAFLIVMVLLLPYYRKKATEPSIPTETVTELQRELNNARNQVNQAQTTIRSEAERADRAEQAARDAQAKLENAQNQLEQAQADARAANERATRAEQESQNARSELEARQAQISSLQRELNKTFLLVHIHWPTMGPDIDLHVVDPNGNDFNWQNRTVSGSTGNLSVDSLIGPGNEVFTDSKATPGNYKVYVHFFNVHTTVQETTVFGSIVFKDGTQALPSVELKFGQPKQLMATLNVNAEGQIRLVPPAP